MLAQLLERVLGNKKPSIETVKQDLYHRWQEWLHPIKEDKPTGEDLTYHDDFIYIKEELDKLSDIDYSAVAYLSEQILKQQSKDLRVATYYCYARLQKDGIEGFADGLELIAGLLGQFGNQLYPSRNIVRRNAIEWLTSIKFIEQLNKLEPFSKTAISRILTALNFIVLTNESLFIDETHPSKKDELLPDLNGLIRFFDTNVSDPIQKTKIATTNSVQEEVTELIKKDQQNIVEIRSQRDLLEQSRKMAFFLREKTDNALAAGRLLRVIRWDTIVELPPSDHLGRTRLPPPRPELKQNNNHLWINQEWHQLFERVESIFMEGANHFWFDLQRYVILSLQKMGAKYEHWASALLMDLGLILEKLKGIETLKFESGAPFADEETLSWIHSSVILAPMTEDTEFNPIIMPRESDWNELEVHAKELAVEQGLEVAFQWLQNLPDIQPLKQQIWLRYTQARIAEQVNRPEIAIRLLKHVNELLKDIHLVDWEPTLTFDIKAYLVKLLNKKAQQRDNLQSDILSKIEILQDELVSIDPMRAVIVIK